MDSFPRTRACLQHTRRGFTLLELMVSLTVGGIAIASMYAISAASTHQFHQQQQIANAQTALRAAMDQVKRDVARAGYLFTAIAKAPPGFVQHSCMDVGSPLDWPLSLGGDGSLAAFSFFDDDVQVTDGVNDALDPTRNNGPNGFTADDLVMFANYETADQYGPISVIDSQTIAVDQDGHNFQRDFTQWYQGLPNFDAAAFDEAFALNRLIRIQTTGRMRHFATITGVDAPTSTSGVDSDVRIHFAPAIPPDCMAAAEQGWVAPVSAIRYFVQNATGEAAARFPTATGPVAQLIRQEVRPDAKRTPLSYDPVTTKPSNTREVLDYVVAFNLAFTMNAATSAGAPDNYVPGVVLGGDPTSIKTAVNANPERIRAVSIDLAVRTPEQDPKLPFGPTCANLGCFQVFTTSPGAARVRHEHAEVFVPNVALEGY